jgi:lipopolysaccharide biosynthesis protein
MPIIDKEVDGKKTQVFNQAGYDQFTAVNAQLIAAFLNSKSLAYREYVISNYGFRQYWDKLLEDAIPAD